MATPGIQSKGSISKLEGVTLDKQLILDYFVISVNMYHIPWGHLIKWLFKTTLFTTIKY